MLEDTLAKAPRMQDELVRFSTGGAPKERDSPMTRLTWSAI